MGESEAEKLARMHIDINNAKLKGMACEALMSLLFDDHEPNCDCDKKEGETSE